VSGTASRVPKHDGLFQLHGSVIRAQTSACGEARREFTWAFEFEDQPYFAGFRAMASNGLTLPVFNVHRMMAKMSGQRVETRSSRDVGLEEIITSGVRASADVAALASLDSAKRQMTVLVWHYHDDDVAGADAAVELSIAGLPSTGTPLKLVHHRVDEQHSNAYTLWKSLGSPTAPSRGQYAQLEAASQLATLTGAPATIAVDGGSAKLKFQLPRQAVSLLVVSW
jgi:xylan 1,4-beta-xylosidase